MSNETGYLRHLARFVKLPSLPHWKQCIGTSILRKYMATRKMLAPPLERAVFLERIFLVATKPWNDDHGELERALDSSMRDSSWTISMST